MGKKEDILIIEALLFATPHPLTQKQVNQIFDTDPPNLNNIISELNIKYQAENHAFEIQTIAGGYQINSKPEFELWIRRLLNKTGKLYLSTAALESLAVIAYKQPVNRFEIESIRGVDCSGVLKTLLSKKLVCIKGRDDGPGRPLLYGTTDDFLEAFGLGKISEIPKLKEIDELSKEQESFNEFQVDILQENLIKEDGS
ncbi:MAG: SMC-Scp complex subunit ScpB [Candidatus Marinimicrobia bacterium]|nr:SMC-Scp complex subunit ScpB [Candidatus Neomarinimicrobiota bacterium]|tara:strand:+ start:278 stop:874 length:597 start_codon:yes stop_codon:yes gene_type:complete